jgi:GNAT superfamily N-acetyltransferase
VTVVKAAEPCQAAAIAALAEEMDRFYGATDLPAPPVRREQINDALFGDQPAAYALLAWQATRLVGLAAYSFLWPAVGLTRSLFLKELYVAQAARRSGVGAALMRELFAVAHAHDCSRVEWQTEITNHDAQAFYARLGGHVHDGKVFYRLEGDQLRQVTDDDQARLAQ